MKLFERFDRSSPQPGLYHFTYEGDGERSRVHLRLDPGGTGILVVNADRMLHLNPTAATMARLVLEKRPDAEAVKTLRKQYRVSPGQAANDYAQIKAQIEELIRPDGACPIHDLDLDVIYPFTIELSAPTRMDLAITYRCNNECSHCYNARPREFNEISTRDWKAILKKLWEAGIPHIIFTGGEPTLREDLAELIAYAEGLGQITGLNTNGRRLSDPGYLQKLVAAGLDHVQITVESHDPHIHDTMVACSGAWKQTIAGLRNALNSPLYVMTNTTMLALNAPHLAETLEFLAEVGVRKVGLNALIYSGKGGTVGTGIPERELSPLLELARQHIDSNGQQLIWYTPTQYCNFDPQELGLGVKGCSAAYRAMCMEPDGAVLPCQSYYQPLGNLLKDPWEKIWNHPLARSLRKRRTEPEPRCQGCALLGECGGGCPLVPAGT